MNSFPAVSLPAVRMYYEIGDEVTVKVRSNFDIPFDAKATFTIITPTGKQLKGSGEVHSDRVTAPLVIDSFGKYKIDFYLVIGEGKYWVNEHIYVEKRFS